VYQGRPIIAPGKRIPRRLTYNSNEQQSQPDR
jgi:hypothetical protein